MPVVDASALLKAVLDEDHAPAFREWYGPQVAAGVRFVAPDLIPYELLHALSRRVPPAKQTGAWWARDIVRDLLVAVDLDHDAWARFDPHLRHVSAYDAAYLALAIAKSTALVTYDHALAAIAREAGVPVISPGA